MKITHRSPAAASTPASAAEPELASLTLPSSFDKAPRISCCCRISELMPLLRQAHDAARAARLAAEQTDVAA